MAHSQVKVSIPFESLIRSVRELDFEDKYRLWEFLEEQIAQIEEESLEKDPAIQKQIREARSAYKTGDYETIDEYLSRRKGRSS